MESEDGKEDSCQTREQDVMRRPPVASDIDKEKNYAAAPGSDEDNVCDSLNGIHVAEPLAISCGRLVCMATFALAIPFRLPHSA